MKKTYYARLIRALTALDRAEQYAGQMCLALQEMQKQGKEVPHIELQIHGADIAIGVCAAKDTFCKIISEADDA